MLVMSPARPQIEAAEEELIKRVCEGDQEAFYELVRPHERSIYFAAVGDFTFRRVPSNARPDELVIHQLKYPHDGADKDVNVIFPIERLQQLVQEGVIGGLTRNFFSFIGYNMGPDRFESTVAENIAHQVVAVEHADAALLAPA